MASCCCPHNLSGLLKSGLPSISNPSTFADASETTPLKDSGRPVDDEDIVTAAGVKLPAIFLTKFRRWFCLWSFSIINSVASGPMTMYPALEPILIQEKVFEGPAQMKQLTFVYSLAIGLLMVGTLPMGIAYDSYGPRWMAVVCTMWFTVLSVGVGLAIKFQSLNWMLYFVYPVCLTLGYAKSYGGYGYQWLLPDSQNTVNSIVVATQSLADALVLVCVWLHNTYGMALWTYFWGLAGLSVLTATLNLVIVPSRKEHISYAAAVTAFMEACGAGYGSSSADADRQGESDTSVKTSGWRWWDNVKGTLKTFQKFPIENFLFIAGSCSMYMFSWYPTMQMYPYYLNLFGADDASRLVNDFALIYGILGALAMLCGGQLLDRVGLQKALIVMILLNCVAVTAFLTTTYSSQICFLVCLSLSVSVAYVLTSRFVMLYAPVQLFGTYVGVILTVMGLFQVTVSSVAAVLSGRVVHYHEHGHDHLLELRGPSNPLVEFVQLVTCLFFVLNVILWVALVIYWYLKPPPVAGSITCRQAGIPDESEYEALDQKDLQYPEDAWL